MEHNISETISNNFQFQASGINWGSFETLFMHIVNVRKGTKSTKIHGLSFLFVGVVELFCLFFFRQVDLAPFFTSFSLLKSIDVT